MGDVSIPTSELEKMRERIVTTSLKKFLCSDKGKEHVKVKDDENKGELEKKEQSDETWQDEEFFAKKEIKKKAEFEAEKLDKLEKMNKKIEKINVFMKSKGLDQYLDMDDDEDEELE
ncbi:hypothetical protein JCGZ_15537 [Jatropha curcas]|uniref:Uncharacterized protein n=1 Tax=Jatropha curcas TaxID=180498 RepID=A0A067K3G4_JATCU|nr:hypothetical protein JCGZ_15537 [Jatropha curcas]